MTKRFMFLLVVMGCSETDVSAPPAAPIVAPVQYALTTDKPFVAEDLDPADDVVHVALEALITMHIVPGGLHQGYSYNGGLPGPTIEAKLGDTLRVDLTNSLDMPTTIHWHGVHVPWAMDGVTWMTEPIHAGEEFAYEFPLNQAGTYWYHPHFNTAQQVEGGLYGVLVVHDPADPVPDREFVLVFDGLGEFSGNGSGEHVEGDEHEDEEHKGGAHAHAMEPTVRQWLVNKELQPTITMKGGTWARVRMVNTSNMGYLALEMPDMRHIAGDQGLLPALQKPSMLVLGPGDRADVVWLIGEEGFDVVAKPYTLNGGATIETLDAPWGRSQTVLTVAVEEPAPAPPMPTFPWSGQAVSPDPEYTDVVYTLSGSDHAGQWLINGERFPDVTVETLSLDSQAVIEIRNLSRTHHPFHIHGHGFEVLSTNGVASPYYRFEDTIDVGIRQRVRLRLHADNPGDWMTHCHILPHAEDGMMTVLRVE